MEALGASRNDEMMGVPGKPDYALGSGGEAVSYTSWELEGLYVLRWGLRPEVEDIAAQSLEIAEARSRQGKLLVGLFIMPIDSAAPDDAFRKQQALYLPAIFANLEFAIAVFEGNGFIASLKRSALVAILLLSKQRHPLYVRQSLEAALIQDPPRPFNFDASKALAQLLENMSHGAFDVARHG
jgi:hypothetical protein